MNTELGVSHGQENLGKEVSPVYQFFLNQSRAHLLLDGVKARYNRDLVYVFKDNSPLEERFEAFNASHLARFALYVMGRFEAADMAKSDLEVAFSRDDVELFLGNLEKPNESEETRDKRVGEVDELKRMYKDARINTAKGVFRKAKIFFS